MLLYKLFAYNDISPFYALKVVKEPNFFLHLWAIKKSSKNGTMGI